MSELFSDYGYEGHVSEKRSVLHDRRAQDVLIGREAEILNDVAAPGVAAAIWQRNLDASFSGWINNLSSDQLPTLRVIVPVNLVEEAVQTACDIAKTPPGPERKMLIGDAGALALIYSQVMGSDHVRVRFDVSDGVMCPKFHLDHVPARLLCTYRGPGTQYVPEVHLEDSKQIGNMKTGAVGIFRGTKWMSEERSSLLHRSPAIQPGKGPRLLLVIDAAE